MYREREQQRVYVHSFVAREIYDPHCTQLLLRTKQLEDLVDLPSENPCWLV